MHMWAGTSNEAQMREIVVCALSCLIGTAWTNKEYANFQYTKDLLTAGGSRIMKFDIYISPIHDSLVAHRDTYASINYAMAIWLFGLYLRVRKLPKRTRRRGDDVPLPSRKLEVHFHIKCARLRTFLCGVRNIIQLNWPISMKQQFIRIVFCFHNKL